jgi:O-antigen ligase
MSLGGIRLPVALLIILTISRVHQYYGIIVSLRPALLAYGWAFAVLALGTRKGVAFENWKQLPIRLVLLLGGAALLSMPLGISFGGSASFFLSSYSKVLILCLLIAAAMRSPDDFWTMVWAYVIGVGLLCWLCLTKTTSVTGSGGFVRMGDAATYDANDIGLVCLTGIPLCFITLRTSRTVGKVASVAIIALSCVAIAKTGSRGAFIGIVAVALALLVLAREMSVLKRVAIGVAGAAALGLAAPAGYLKQMSTMFNTTSDYNYTAPTGRMEIARRGFGYLKRNPITGIGLMNFARAEGTLSEAAQEFEMGGAGVKWSAAHNSYLQAVVEMGIIGGGVFLTLIWVGLTSGRRLRRRLGQRSPPDRRAGLLIAAASDYLPIAFVSFAVPAFFLSFAYMDPMYILSAFAAAAFGLVGRTMSPPARSPRPGRFQSVARSSRA